MPMYEYHCQDCDKTFEELLAANHDGPVPCEHCKSENTARIMSTTVIHMPNPMRGAVNPAHRAAAAPPQCTAGKGGFT
ncbi:MAG: zinc ribbon domain-containing protein [Desulfovibrio sp.]|nr:MAG: zinc ribbon domain-containing protein [Desulfovibrio sp.]